MARITAICNQKGGVGKTTTAHALAAGLSARFFRVLIIDADPQGNLSYSMRADTNNKGLFEAFYGEPVTVLIQPTSQGDIIASSTRLIGADKIFVEYGMEYLLSDAIAPIKEKYDYIIIDSPPQLGVLIVNALVACTDIIIPLTADMYAMQGLSQLILNVDKVKRHPNPNIRIDGILLTRHSGRSILSRDLKESIEARAAEMGTRLYNTVIREGVAVRECQTQRTNVFEYAPKSKVASDYDAFVREYLNCERLS